MTSFSSGPVYIETPVEPDRSQFLRDAESASRLMTPDDAIAFLKSLCRVRAITELGPETPDAELDYLAMLLYRLCVSIGLDQVPTRHVKITMTSRQPEG